MEDTENTTLLDVVSEELNLRIFTEDSDNNTIIDTESEELNIRVFVCDNEDGGGGTIVVHDPDECPDCEEFQDSGCAPCEECLIVVKNYRRTFVSGTTSIDISQYARKFIIDKIIFTLHGGTPSVAKAGWSPGTDEVAFLTDIASLELGLPVSVSVEMVPPPTGNVVHITVPTGIYHIDLILIRYKI